MTAASSLPVRKACRLARTSTSKAAAGLKVPQITSLTNDLRKAGAALPEGIYTVDDAFDAILPLLRGKGERK